MANHGEFDIQFMTHNNFVRNITFQNADVGMPIVSMTKVADEGNFIGMGRKGGFIEHEETGERVPFIRRAGVYFMKMKVPIKDVLRPEAARFTPP